MTTLPEMSRPVVPLQVVHLTIAGHDRVGQGQRAAAGIVDAAARVVGRIAVEGAGGCRHGGAGGVVDAAAVVRLLAPPGLPFAVKVSVGQPQRASDCIRRPPDWP